MGTGRTPLWEFRFHFCFTLFPSCSGGLGCGGEETSGPHPEARVLVQVLGLPPPPTPTPSCPLQCLEPSPVKSALTFLCAVSRHVLFRSAACHSRLGCGDPVSTRPQGSTLQCIRVQVVWKLLRSQRTRGAFGEESKGHVGTRAGVCESLDAGSGRAAPAL